MVKKPRQKKVSFSREKLAEAVVKAAEAAGKQYGEEGLVSYLEAQAVATPSPFLTLLSKVLFDTQDETLPHVTRIEIIAPKDKPYDEKS